VRYLLDTDTCIFLMKGASTHAVKKFASLDAGDVGVSVATVCELQYGVDKSLKARENQVVLEDFLIDLEVLPLNPGACAHYGKIRAGLERKGRPIGAMDLLIASHALDLSAILVTNNGKKFSRVPGLKTENWLAGR
jgi:tRNA(fMet)-specific endonuclease VapC